MWTAAAVGIAVLLYVLPGAADACIYDRQAIACGEVWRLVTGHWVHLSARHLAFDALALAALGAALERQRDRFYVPLLIASPLVISAALLLDAHLERYAGLSGVAYALAAYLGLRTLLEDGAARWIGGILLALLAAKSMAEIASGAPTFAKDATAPALLAHAAGAATGIAAFLASRWVDLRT